VLAAAQARHRRGRDFVVALVVAHEIGQRLARASSAMIQSLTETGNTPDAFGINNESIVGGALGAARLLGLSGEQAAHAMGLAAYYCSVPVTWDWEEASPKSLVKYTPVGLMAQNALHAAMLAQAGFTGHPGVLDAPHGFARILRTGRWDTQVLTDQLGSRWWFLEQQYKPWPCCRFFHSQLDLLDGLMRAHAVLADDVVAIDTYGPPFVANPAPYEVRTHVDVQFSLPFCMALVAHGVPPGASWQTVPTLADGRLHGFAKRVRMHIDADAMARKRLDPRSWGARVEVTLADGRCLRAEAEHARGTNGTAVACSDDELEAKFRAHASAHLSPYKTDLAIDAIWHLEDLSDTQQLGNLLAPTL
jgi:2-methylcitrate dehydratase PrpD